MDNFEIVIAHYNEDLKWLEKYDIEPRKIKVYSKGRPPNIQCINFGLPNVGREAHTYLQYIINNYNNLPNIVFFTQADVSDHTTNIDKLVLESINLDVNKFSSNIITNYRKFINGLTSDYRLPDNYLDHSKIGVEPSKYRGDEWFRLFVSNEVNVYEPMTIYWHAIFSVRREAIHSRPIEYYKFLLEQVSTSNCPEEAHYMERSWFYIFNLHKPLMRDYVPLIRWLRLKK